MLQLEGQRFGKLLVLSLSAEKQASGGLKWNCLCDCGKHCVISANALKYNNSKSCGCVTLQKVLERNRARTNPDGGFIALFRRYKTQAKWRKIQFDLDMDTFRELVTSNCTYCNRQRSQTIISKGGIVFVYNGIDRKDNKKGYMSNNCVSCCSVCNYMKSDFTYDEFIEQCKIIAKFHTNNDPRNEPDREEVS